jgi:hypothetical protein
MTLTMAWVRNAGPREELVFASDSRLSGGSDWDCCPKIMLLRGDCLIAFAGDTKDAYPFMFQFRNWLELDPRALSRNYDINDLKKRIRTIFNDMRLFIGDLPKGQEKPDPPDCELIFGGWSWKSQSFKFWRFHYDKSRDAFDFQPVGIYISVSKKHPIIFAGTRAAVEQARDRIIGLLKSKGRFHTTYFDMEPFEVLRDIIREGTFADVGGPPQIAKIYKSGLTQVFAVRWPMAQERQITILGRPLLPREINRLRVIDPDQINFVPQKTLEKRALKSQRLKSKGGGGTTPSSIAAQ